VSSHAKEKAFREQKTAFSPCGGSEKPAMRVAKEFAKPLIRKKIARTNPTHHEHEAKWEIPVRTSGARRLEEPKLLSGLDKSGWGSAHGIANEHSTPPLIESVQNDRFTSSRKHRQAARSSRRRRTGRLGGLDRN